MIKIYTSNTCPACVVAKEKMKEHNISYEEIDIGVPSNRMALLQKGIMQVPAIFKDEEHIESVDDLIYGVNK